MKKTKGISLIVLIVTIIVMIIIAGAIIISLSQTNVIDQAETAVQKHNEASEKDILTLAWGEYMASSITNPAAELKVEGATVTGNNIAGWTVTFTSGSKYTVSAKGQITKDGAQEVEETNWKYAWTSDGVTWSDTYYRDTLPEGTKLEGKIIAKIYETDEIIEEFNIGDGKDPKILPAGKGYVLDIQGQGDMPMVVDDNEEEFWAWLGETITYNSDSGREFKENPVVPYITKVIIGEGITNIPVAMLYGYSDNLKEIQISDTVTTIGINAFYDCPKLMNVKIGKNVTKIEAGNFSICMQLKRIVIPEHVNYIGAGCCYGSLNLKEIYIETTHSDLVLGKETFESIAQDAVVYVRNDEMANKFSEFNVSPDYNWIAPTN